MTDKDAIDILKNCLADYVIGDYCTDGHCIDENMCKYEDCPFHTAIYTVIELIEKQQKRIKELEIALIEEDYKHRITLDKMAGEIKIKKVEGNK